MGIVGVGGERRARSGGDRHDGASRRAGHRHLRLHRFGTGAEAEHRASGRERQPVGFSGGAGKLQRQEGDATAPPGVGARAATTRPCREAAHGIGNGSTEQRLVNHCAGGGAPGRRGTSHQAPHIVRAARLRPGAAQAFAAEGLRAHHCANLIAVDVDVAHANAIDDVLNAIVDAGVQAEGEPVA